MPFISRMYFAGLQKSGYSVLFRVYLLLETALPTAPAFLFRHFVRDLLLDKLSSHDILITAFVIVVVV